MADIFHPGQRWISTSEPELGLGLVRKVTTRTVLVEFAASRELREYARDNAPLRRARFRVGDTIQSRTNVRLLVQTATERNGLIFYHGEGTNLSETDLSDAISFNQPEERLLAGQVDETETFDLRFAAVRQQHRRRQSPARGFAGGRMELIPHQLYIAAEVAGRLVPRVLLADEVGLGKTIEASLILHRLLLTGRVQRVLILVPDSLVHQWFVELLRRFNLWFHIFDEERCDAIETANPEANPFLDDQLVLASLGLFSGSERRTQQALAAGWDLLVVDEAHHLGWSPESVSPEYQVVEGLGRRIPGLLLLTATPEQLGMASHFARLRLLDPERFHDLREFMQEAGRYRDVARVAEQLLQNVKLSLADGKNLVSILGQDEKSVQSKLEKIGEGDVAGRMELIEALLDQHGTGRVMFRNTRATISGFPRRRAQLVFLPSTASDTAQLDALTEEFQADTEAGLDAFFFPDFSQDVRLIWLVEHLRAWPRQKALLICRTQRKVRAIEAALRQRLNLKMAVFHEGLSLVQRDRHAAWFAEEDGARLLICSEIGSEGRNFQFAQHLILFDLPLDPELLEQRIGRLDRIGQTAEIQIWVPFMAGSPQEALARWHHAGLNSLEKNLHGGRELLEHFGPRVREWGENFPMDGEAFQIGLQRLLEDTQLARKELAIRLEEGRDRLLELNSFRAGPAARLVQEIKKLDADVSLDEFMLAIFDHYSIHVEELAPRVYRLGSAGVFADSFPGLPAEGFTVTCERARALAREEIQFLTWDHPLVTGALDLLLGSEKGNSSFARWPDAKNSGLYLEVIYLLECVAPPALHLDRFLPPWPLRVLVDQRGNDVGKTFPAEGLSGHLKNAEAYALWERSELREELLPEMLEKARGIAERQISGVIAQARQDMTAQLEHERVRLRELQKVNRSVREEEIMRLAEQHRSLAEHLGKARLRLDALRLIQRGPER